MKGKISLATLGVSNLERSRLFYEALGWRTRDFDPAQGIVFFDLDGTWLALFPRQGLADDAQVTSDGSGFRGITLAHNEPSRQDVDRAFAEAVAAGAEVVKTPQPTDWGGYSGYFADPDGFLWEVAHNPFTDLT